MGEMTTLTAKDNHTLAAYIAAPKGTPKGALVVIQEIFGVNSHIRSVCDGYAADGYYCVAPALFDRVQRNVELGYSQDDIVAGRALREKMQWPTVKLDVDIAIAAASRAGRVGITGYCYGGGVVSYAAAHCEGLDAAIGYYGGPWASLIDAVPRCATMLHFAAHDSMIPVSLSADMKNRHSTIITHVYDADHGFNCDQRSHYDAAAAVTARRRTLALLEAALG